MSEYGVWDRTGKCHGDFLTLEQALEVAARCDRLIGYAGPFLVATNKTASMQGYNNVLGVSL